MSVDQKTLDKYQLTIGIECHVQLATATKLFSPSDNDARDSQPNMLVNAIDYGLPGMLPVLNFHAIELAARAGKALNAEVAKVSRFDRKHYFYPDLPKGYQTTQMYHPIIIGGYVDIYPADSESVRVRIHHAHLEEDAGKLTHYGDYSLVDLNRAGTPLIEIVSEPDMHSPSQARSYATELHRLMTYAKVSYGDLFLGNMRFDVNVSVAPVGAAKLGNRAEVKNLNSFRSVERAAEYEYHRQVEMLERGETVAQETRGWSDDTGKTTSQRSKENAVDYRYMPDPDVPPVILTSDEIDSMQQDMPEMPNQLRQKLAEAGVDNSLVEVGLDIADKSVRQFISQVAVMGNQSARKRILNWLLNDVEGRVSAGDFAWNRDNLDLEKLEELAGMAESSEVSSNSALKLLFAVLESGAKPRAEAERQNLLQVSDSSQIEAVVDQVLADPGSQKSINDIRNGKDKAIGYLVGQVMKLSEGKANPELARQIIRQKLD